MKKFSKITNQKINEEPKEVNKIDESDILKYKVRSLIDQFLRIRSNGSVDNRYRAGSVTIEGKELLAEAILDLLTDDKKSEQVKILESLKNEVGDWQAIDNKIESLNKEKTLISNRNKFKSLLENYTEVDLLLKVIPTKNVLFASETVGAVQGIDPLTNFYFDDTKRYIDASPSADLSQKQKIFSSNALGVYPRLRAHPRCQGC